LARSYESNGPDVKIRGTAAHIAEKYMSLARDHLASGDLVAAESYLQHAEHYNRIIMAAQTQFSGQPNAQGEGPNGGGSYRNPRWNSDDEGVDDDVNEGGGGGDIRPSGGGDFRQGSGGDHLRQGGGGQDRERNTGDREHHGGGRDRGRQGGNGREAARDTRDTNGSDQPEAQPSDEPAPDTTVS
jgi:hypothetical protein